MKCRDCKYFYTNESMTGLYICVNGDSENFGQYTGVCCEDECKDGKDGTHNDQPTLENIANNFDGEGARVRGRNLLKGIHNRPAPKKT